MSASNVKEKDKCALTDGKYEKLKVEKNIKFKKRLIFKVCRHCSLYDPTHKFFSNVAKKELVWQQIAKELKSTVNECKDTWYELRYNYQRHARRLRHYFIHGSKKNRKRPAMYFESQLMFLWRFVDYPKTCKITMDAYGNEDAEFSPETTEAESQKTLEDTQNRIADKEGECNEEEKNDENQKPIDDDLILVEQPVEVIVIDEDEDVSKPGKQFKLTATMKVLISQIKTYPELYDCDHSSYKNYTTKSYIWNAIAGTLGDKATKLMKCWIVMQTRYEWEICQTKQNSDAATSELQVQLEFLKKFILKNPDTVYKQSYYLKSAWYEPIDYFKDIYSLIIRMKKVCDVVHITDSLLKTPEKSKQYLSLWTEVASLKGSTAGQCETTWLIMRNFYWELMYMRQQNYQLTDKWYFETIISDLYAISKTSQTAKQQELQATKQIKVTKKAFKRPAQTSAVSLGAPSATRPPAPTITLTPTLASNVLSVSSATTSYTMVTKSINGTTFTLPKITAAVSLAPQNSNKGTLQIKQIPGLPSLSPAPQAHNVPNVTVTTPASSTTTIPAQMSMAFNLPSKTKVTPIPMPPLIRPEVHINRQTTVGSKPPTIIPIRSRPILNPSTPKIQLALCSKTSNTPTTTAHISTNPQTSMLGKSNANTSSATTTPAQPIASFKVTSMSQNSPTTTTANSISVQAATMAPTSATTTASSNQMPKIAGAVSLLNPNEILIELIASQSGNQLVVHGPSLSAKYQLPMPAVAKLIREVLAIPLLHNKRNNQPSLINYYWDHISSKFNLPVHICRACWNFLLENFNHFPQIAPLKELMKPFQTTLNVWKESFTLFTKFDDHCASKGWLQYKQRLPEVVECISGYPVLYADISSPNTSEKLSDMETLCAWRTISLRFPKIPDIPKIWAALKLVFCQYMADLEFGIDNKWPLNWWRSLARLKFLVEAKYSTNEPFYYIVSNKMVEEIDKCAMMEMKNRYNTDKFSTNAEKEEGTAEAEVNKAEKKDATDLLMNSNKRSRKEVELTALLAAIQKHPLVIYGKADNKAKCEAWKNVAQELQMEVTDCLLAFRHATEMYFAYKKQDLVNRCRINERYYKKFDEIVRMMPSGKRLASRNKLNIKTPFELNQSLEVDNVSNDTGLIFPERYISDICMSNSPSNLVVKNWVFALGNIHNFSESSNLKLKNILKKYLNNVK